jgi:hypothetical protein
MSIDRKFENTVLASNSCFRSLFLPIFTWKQGIYLFAVTIFVFVSLLSFSSFLVRVFTLSLFAATIGVLSSSSPALVITKAEKGDFIRRLLVSNRWIAVSDDHKEQFINANQRWFNSWENDVVELIYVGDAMILTGPYITLRALARQFRQFRGHQFRGHNTN